MPCAQLESHLHQGAERSRRGEALREGPRLLDAVLEHLPCLYQAALWYTGNPTDAQQLVKEGCLRVRRELEPLQGETRLRPWLHGVLVNSFMEGRPGLRRELRGAWQQGEEGAYGGSGGGEGWVKRGSLESVSDDDVEQALTLLPLRHRIPLVLADGAGLSRDEIASTLGIPAATVRALLREARAALWQLAVGSGVHPVSRL